MREILAGVVHWSTFHEPIDTNVSSYFVAGVVTDPKWPDEELPGTPQQVVLSSGLHHRDAERFGVPIRAPREAAGRLAGRLEFEPYGDGEEIAPGITAIQVGAICPDEYALHIDVGDGAILFADGLIRYGETLQFVPDSLMGDDPEDVKAGLMDAFRGLLERDFDHLLFAHGEPLIGGGKAALRDFVG